jgi:hypothetical protein
MKSFSVIRFILNTLQLLIGIALGLALMVGGSVAAGYYLFTKLSVAPERPSFAEEKPQKPVVKPAPSPAVSPSPAIAAKVDASPSPSPTPSPEAEAGLYKGVINWSEGLILRDAPGNAANRLGGVGFNQQVVVLEESPDQNWQRIRIVATGKTGWIKAGNLDKVP